jgi:hypothetical protein
MNVSPSDEQGMLDFALPDSGVAIDPPNTARAKNSIQAMVDLPLDRPHARDAGDLIYQVVALRQYRPFNGRLAVLQRPHRAG